MSVELYAGDFLVSPIPLELSLNYCSHACAFCFANLGTPDRTADVPSIHRMLTSFGKRKSLPARLLAAGAPVLVSNKVDPFAHSNYQQAVPLFELMTEMGVPFTVQTRGGRGIDDVLAFAPPSVWYVSVSQEDDAIRKAIEPGAPPIADRFELMVKLKAKGHRVIAALNPLVREWIPNPGRMLERAKAAGAEGVWLSSLHLNGKQVNKMSERERGAIGLPILDRAKKRRMTLDEHALEAEARAAAADLGIEAYSGGQWQPSAFWKPYQETYEAVFPVMQDFVNECHAHLRDGDVITLEDWLAFFDGTLPPGTLNLREYVYVNCRGSKYDNLAYKADVTRLTFRQLLTIAWREPTLSFSPAQVKCFAYAGQRQGDGWAQLMDEKGMPYLVFRKTPTEEFFAEIDEAA